MRNLVALLSEEPLPSHHNHSVESQECSVAGEPSPVFPGVKTPSKWPSISVCHGITSLVQHPIGEYDISLPFRPVLFRRFFVIF
jgi:hypothetical protein